QQTCITISSVFDATEYLLDPHTAIGVQAARETVRDKSLPMITLGTAHPAKFPDAVRKAGQQQDPALPHHMADLFQREERYKVLPHDLSAVKQFMVMQLSEKR